MAPVPDWPACCFSLPAVKQRQAGVPAMDFGARGELRRSPKIAGKRRRPPPSTSAFATKYTSPLYDKGNTNTNLIFNNGVPSVFIGGQLDYPRGLMFANKHNFAPRLGIAKNLPGVGALHAPMIRGDACTALTSP